MAWKEVTVEELAKSLGANVAEVREKQRLVKLIVKTRVYGRSFLDSVGRGIEDADSGRTYSSKELRAALASSRTRK